LEEGKKDDPFFREKEGDSERELLGGDQIGQKKDSLKKQGAIRVHERKKNLRISSPREGGEAKRREKHLSRPFENRKKLEANVRPEKGQWIYAVE